MVCMCWYRCYWVFLSFHLLGLKDCIPVIRLEGKHLYLLKHLFSTGVFGNWIKDVFNVRIVWIPVYLSWLVSSLYCLKLTEANYNYRLNKNIVCKGTGKPKPLWTSHVLLSQPITWLQNLSNRWMMLWV